MNRFPLLTMYYSLLIILAILVLVGGLFVAYGMAQTETRLGETEFKFGTFLGVFLGFGVVAFGLALSAEIIRLFLAMEDHLYKMRSQLSGLLGQEPAEQRQTTITEYVRTSAETTAAYPTVVLRGIVRPERVRLIVVPGGWLVITTATRNQVLSLIGRTDDCKWVQVEHKSEAWVETSDLSIEGDVSTLPVKYSSQG